MSKLRMSVSYSDSYGEVTFDVLDEDDKGVDTRTYAIADIPADNSAHVHAYGLNKVLTDRTSDEKDKEAKLKAMDGVFEQLCTGEWAKERTIGAPIVSAEVEALADLMGLSIVEAQMSLAAYPKEQRKTILAHENVVEVGRKIREKRAKAGTAALLDEFVS